MDWVALSYSLPAHASSTPRVTLWRRLRRLGAVSPTGSLYVLPASDECVEAFQWLAQEIRQAAGEALVMRVQKLEGMGDARLIALFNQARQNEYEELATQLADLEQQIETADESSHWGDPKIALDRLQRQYAEVAGIDYFHCPAGLGLAAQLKQVRQRLAPADLPSSPIRPADLAQFQGRRWATRPRPHVDRLACAWLIRRLIDPAAVIRYTSAPETTEVAFDADPAEFSHQGNLCTFEVMLRAFRLDEIALQQLAEIVHEIDLHDGRYLRPETAGVDMLLKGWLLADVSDAELERRGVVLFDGLYAAFRQSLQEPAAAP